MSNIIDPIQTVLKARGLMKRYGTVVAMNGADLDLYPDEVLGVIGDNGAGKTTLIRAISGATVPDYGFIELTTGFFVTLMFFPLVPLYPGINSGEWLLAIICYVSIMLGVILGNQARKSKT